MQPYSDDGTCLSRDAAAVLVTPWDMYYLLEHDAQVTQLSHTTTGDTSLNGLPCVRWISLEQDDGTVATSSAGPSNTTEQIKAPFQSLVAASIGWPLPSSLRIHEIGGMVNLAANNPDAARYASEMNLAKVHTFVDAIRGLNLPTSTAKHIADALIVGHDLPRITPMKVDDYTRIGFGPNFMQRGFAPPSIQSIVGASRNSPSPLTGIDSRIDNSNASRLVRHALVNSVCQVLRATHATNDEPFQVFALPSLAPAIQFVSLFDITPPGDSTRATTKSVVYDSTFDNDETYYVSVERMMRTKDDLQSAFFLASTIYADWVTKHGQSFINTKYAPIAQAITRLIGALVYVAKGLYVGDVAMKNEDDNNVNFKLVISWLLMQDDANNEKVNTHRASDALYLWSTCPAYSQGVLFGLTQMMQTDLLQSRIIRPSVLTGSGFGTSTEVIRLCLAAYYRGALCNASASNAPPPTSDLQVLSNHSNSWIASAGLVDLLGPPDYTLVVTEGSSESILPARKIRLPVHGWVMMQWPYFVRCMGLPTEESITKTIVLPDDMPLQIVFLILCGLYGVDAFDSFVSNAPALHLNVSDARYLIAHAQEYDLTPRVIHLDGDMVETDNLMALLCHRLAGNEQAGVMKHKVDVVVTADHQAPIIISRDLLAEGIVPLNDTSNPVDLYLHGASVEVLPAAGDDGEVHRILPVDHHARGRHHGTQSARLLDAIADATGRAKVVSNFHRRMTRALNNARDKLREYDAILADTSLASRLRSDDMLVSLLRDATALEAPVDMTSMGKIRDSFANFMTTKTADMPTASPSSRPSPVPYQYDTDSDDDES